MNDSWPDLYNSNHPQFHDPRFQRRIVKVWRPIPMVENIHEAKLACGHSPLLLGGPMPKVGMEVFCPECYGKTVS